MDNYILPNEPVVATAIPQRSSYIVYIKTNQDDYIIAVHSSAFLTDTTGWVEIDSGYGDKYHHAQLEYFPQPIYDERGIPRYKLVDGEVVERTPEEIEADYVPPSDVKTNEELQEENNLLRAQVQSLSDRGEFIEDCIAEMAMLVYS